MKMTNLIFFICLIGFWSCSPRMKGSEGSMESNNSKGVIKQYRTYAWTNTDVMSGNLYYSGELIEANIKNAVNREMASRGFAQDNENPDILINMEASGTKVKNLMGGYPGYFAGWPYYDPYGYRTGAERPNGTPMVYSREGLLQIDLIDRAKDKIVWRGEVEGSIDNPDNLGDKIYKGVHKLFKQLPEDERANPEPRTPKDISPS